MPLVNLEATHSSRLRQVFRALFGPAHGHGLAHRKHGITGWESFR
jgi:hypothetical protein